MHFYIPTMDYPEGKLRKQSYLQSLQKIKYSEINLTNKVRDMQYENYKDTEEINGQKYQYKWKDMLCSWFRRFNIGKVSLLPTVINGFDAIPIEILMVSISELELIVTFIWNHTHKKN